CPVRLGPAWRTPAAVALARAIDESQDFDRMPELAEALAAAGCDNPRVLAHCRRKGSHVRGCWLLHDPLGLHDPQPPEQAFTWDFDWEHPTIGGELKERLRAFGTDAAGNTDWDEKAALGFADWLESRGDRAWAGYIRVRCALDGQAPGENYPDLYE